MSGFSAAWLALREPVDHAARSAAISAQVARQITDLSGNLSARNPLRVVDLATGTGSNPRYLAQYLSGYQDWTLLDADTRLLAELPARMAAWATKGGWACVQDAGGVVVTLGTTELRVRPQLADLSRFPITAFADRPSLVTASALLDLVSDQWLVELVSACSDINAAALFALTYDGRSTISPGHADDERVLQLVNRHQTGDKGFGSALGPEATARAALHFDVIGYNVLRARSDWTLGPAEWKLQDELIAGWSQAACEVEPEHTVQLRAWERERREAAAAGGLVIVVGHEDLAAWPAS